MSKLEERLQENAAKLVAYLLDHGWDTPAQVAQDLNMSLDWLYDTLRFLQEGDAPEFFRVTIKQGVRRESYGNYVIWVEEVDEADFDESGWENEAEDLSSMSVYGDDQKVGGTMVYILTDERYSRDPQEFDSYDQMVSEIESMCKANGWDFNDDDLKYQTLTK